MRVVCCVRERYAGPRRRIFWVFVHYVSCELCVVVCGYCVVFMRFPNAAETIETPSLSALGCEGCYKC